MKFDVPILFLVFNRPDTTQQVFERIKKLEPASLFIAADGFRSHMPGEKEKCELVKNLILEGIDWPCEVKTLFRDSNLGCGHAVSGAINWFFDQVDEGIVLEDDVLPSFSFFKFCQELLMKYRDDERVYMISGSNFAGVWKPELSSYYFSHYGGIWGWATWKRAWKAYDFNVKLMSNQEVRKKIKTNKNYTPEENELFFKIFEAIYQGSGPDTWDYQWHFTRIIENASSIVPSKNLTSNIGFSENATHTKDVMSPMANMPVYELSDPILHPPDKMVDEELEYKIASLSGLRSKKNFSLSNLFRNNVFNKKN